MTPAEKLSAKKPWRREPRNKVQDRKVTWVCRVREVRESLRLSLEDVALAVKLSKTAYWQIEHGGDPQLTSARRIADFFGKSEKDLWPERKLASSAAAV
jgi:DNA-binding XRE family transcriptional regulator